MSDVKRRKPACGTSKRARAPEPSASAASVDELTEESATLDGVPAEEPVKAQKTFRDLVGRSRPCRSRNTR